MTMLARLVAAAIFAISLLVLPTVATAAGLDETYEKPAATSSIIGTVAQFFQRQGFGKSYALLIGVGEYDHPESFRHLNAPPLDAQRMRDFLRDKAGFDYIVTLTDEKATPERIGQLMESDFPARLNPNDRFLFYFSGHGQTRVLRNERRGYLVLKAAAADRWDRMIDMPRIQEWAGNVGIARHTLFLLDACSSGLAAFEPKGGNDARDRTVERYSQPSHYLLTAGAGVEESYGYGDRSLFTDAFLAAASGQLARPPDGVISLDDIMSMIGRKIDEYKVALHDSIKMTPELYRTRLSDNEGEFFFFAPPYLNSNVATIAAGALPGPVASKGANDGSANLVSQGEAAEHRNDDREAARLYRLAADQGNAQGEVELGRFYEHSLGGLAKDEKEAARLYRLAADQGNAQAESALGVFYSHGLGGVVQDKKESVRLFRLSVDQDYAQGESNLGVSYQKGEGGLAKDEKEAVRLYRLAADQGNAQGEANLGISYNRGEGGLVKDEKEAVRLFRLAADQDNASAEVSLGVSYETGSGGLVKNDMEAARLYRLGADKGDDWGQANLGNLYERGAGGLAKDEKEAVRLYRLAADRGNAEGEAYLGNLYERGAGGLAKDENEAVRLFRLSADQGNAVGEANLGFAYETGVGGLAKDRKEAVRLYHLSAAQGDEYAQSALSRLK